MKIATAAIVALTVCLPVAGAQEGAETPAEARQRLATLLELRDVLAARNTEEDQRRLAIIEEEIAGLRDAVGTAAPSPAADGPLAEAQRGARESLDLVESELAELEGAAGEAPEPVPEVYAALRQARIAHLRGMRDGLRKILELRGGQDLAALADHQQRIDQDEMKWWLITEPRLRGRAEIWEMEQRAAAEGNPPQLAQAIQEATALHMRVVADAGRLYESWTVHAALQRRLGEVVADYWRRLAPPQPAAPARAE
jgi:hypothetical protein